MFKRFFIFYCVILVLAVFFSTIVVAQENELLGKAQIIYPWGQISVAEQYTVMADKPYKIGVSVPHLKSSYFVNNAYGIFKEAEKSGCKSVTFLAAKGYDDLETQISQTENLVELGVDAIISAPISSEGNIRSLEEAIKRGIQVFFFGQSCDIRDHSGMFAPNNFIMGQMQAEWTARKLGGKGKVILLSGPAGANWTIVNYEGIMAGFSKYPGIEIIDQKWSDVDPAIGMEITEKMMTIYPEVDAFICSDVIGHGSAQAVRAAGKQDEILVVMTYPENATLSMIEKGLVDYAINTPLVATTEMLVSHVIRMLNNPSDKLAGAIFFVDAIEITKENVNTIDLSRVFAPVDWTVPFGTIEWK